MLEAQFGKMFLCLMCPNEEGFSQVLAEIYLEVVADIRPEIVSEVIGQYISGHRGDGKFAPRPPELAKAARELEAERFPPAGLLEPKQVEPPKPILPDNHFSKLYKPKSVSCSAEDGNRLDAINRIRKANGMDAFNPDKPWHKRKPARSGKEATKLTFTGVSDASALVKALNGEPGVYECLRVDRNAKRGGGDDGRN